MSSVRPSSGSRGMVRNDAQVRRFPPNDSDDADGSPFGFAGRPRGSYVTRCPVAPVVTTPAKRWFALANADPPKTTSPPDAFEPMIWRVWSRYRMLRGDPGSQTRN